MDTREQAPMTEEMQDKPKHSHQFVPDDSQSCRSHEQQEINNISFDMSGVALHVCDGRDRRGLTQTEKSYLDKLAWASVKQILLEAGLLDDEGYLPVSLRGC